MVRKIALIIPVLFLAGCGDSGPDYGPLGDGLKAIGICLVAAAVVRALAELIISENDKSGRGGDSKKRNRHDDKSKGGEP